MIGGMLLEVKDDVKENLNTETKKRQQKWNFVFVTVGDCKAFLLSSNPETSLPQITDLTKGNRGNVDNPQDPGGRIGPTLERGAPDLRNLDFGSVFCQEGDLLVLCSDGIHDNLDPQNEGKTPLDFNLDGDSWKTVKQIKAAIDIKMVAVCDAIKNLVLPTETPPSVTASENANQPLASANSTAKAPNAHPFGSVTPACVTQRLIDHAMIVTQNSRDWMDQNPTKKLPEDFTKYPGKMDHATCVCIKVKKLGPED